MNQYIPGRNHYRLRKIEISIRPNIWSLRNNIAWYPVILDLWHKLELCRRNTFRC